MLKKQKEKKNPETHERHSKLYLYFLRLEAHDVSATSKRTSRDRLTCRYSAGPGQKEHQHGGCGGEHGDLLGNSSQYSSHEQTFLYGDSHERHSFEDLMRSLRPTGASACGLLYR
jgi:hypothetical protein